MWRLCDEWHACWQQIAHRHMYGRYCQITAVPSMPGQHHPCSTVHRARLLAEPPLHQTPQTHFCTYQARSASHRSPPAAAASQEQQGSHGLCTRQRVRRCWRRRLHAWRGQAPGLAPCLRAHRPEAGIEAVVIDQQHQAKNKHGNVQLGLKTRGVRRSRGVETSCTFAFLSKCEACLHNKHISSCTNRAHSLIDACKAVLQPKVSHTWPSARCRHATMMQFVALTSAAFMLNKPTLAPTSTTVSPGRTCTCAHKSTATFISNADACKLLVLCSMH